MKVKLLFMLCFLAIHLNAAKNAHLIIGENYYNMRGINLEKVHKAREEFFTVLRENSSLEDKRIALDRIGRLAVLEGELSPLIYNQKVSNRGGIFAFCMDAASYLNPNVVNAQTPEYYYWKANCMALRAAYSKKYVIDNLFNFADDLMSLINTGRSLFPEYDGGGFDRLNAAIYLKSKEVKVSGLYHPQEALHFCEKAIRINSEFMMAHLLKAQALYDLKRKRDAINYIEQCINNFGGIIENNAFSTIPNGIENKALLHMMIAFKNKIIKKQ